MEYALKEDNIKNVFKKFLLFKAINAINLTDNKINIIYKMINKNELFDRNIFKKIFSTNNNSYISKNLKTNFIKSIKLFIISPRYGFYLLKYYYFIFMNHCNYDNLVNFTFKKIYYKTINKNYNKQLFYCNITQINQMFKNYKLNYKYSLNDDSNYIIISSIYENFLSIIKKNIKLSKIKFYYDKNIHVNFIKNIIQVNKNNLI